MTSPVPVPEPYRALQALPPTTGTFAQRVGGLPTEAQILAHGFDFHPGWWKDRIGNPTWTGFFDALPYARGGGFRRITRRDLLTGLGWSGGCDGPARLGALLAGCYAWGTGDQRWLVPRRALVYTRPDRLAHPLIEARLAAAVDAMQRGTPEDGYRSLLRGRGASDGAVKYLGPSFFTKVLHNADADQSTGRPGRALILDRFVVIGLNHLKGWGLPETAAWPTDVYTRWLAYAHEQAAAPNGPGSAPVRIDTIERAVFRLGRFLYEQRRPPRRRKRS